MARPTTCDEAATSTGPPTPRGTTPRSDSRYSRVFDGDEELGAAWNDTSDTALTSRAAKWWRRKRVEHAHRLRTYTALDWAATAIPCIGWLRMYKVRSSLLMDTVAGVSVAFMVVPQGMSYALLAGLPAVYGLYGAFVPVLVYAVFGSSRHLAVGPASLTSLLVGSTLRDIFPRAAHIDDPNNPGDLAPLQAQYNEAAVQVSCMVAALYLAVAALRLGFLANFLSHSVISGFTTGAAAIIGLMQLRYFLGIDLPATDTAVQTAMEVARRIGETQWREALMCSVWLAWLVSVKTLAKRNARFAWLRPLGPVSVVAAGILVVVAFRLQDSPSVLTVRTVPRGLPRFALPWASPMYDAGKQASTAVVVFLVGFMESISISKALARRHRYRIEVTQEITALGIANLAGSLFSSYPAAGSFARSAVNADVGARSALSGVVTGVLVLFVLLFLTPVFELVPYNAMGAIVLSSVFGLFELSEARFLLRSNPLDFLVWAAAFLGTLVFGVGPGLVIAIGLALLLVIYQSAFPHTAVLGQLPGTRVFRNVRQYPQAAVRPHMCVVRVDAPIYFANVEVVHSRIGKYVSRAEADPRQRPVLFVILDLSPVPFVDSTGMHALMELAEGLRDGGQQLVLANPSRKVQAQLQRVRLLQDIGRQWVFVHTSDAVDACTAAASERLATGVEVQQEGLDHTWPLLDDASSADMLGGLGNPLSGRGESDGK